MAGESKNRPIKEEEEEDDNSMADTNDTLDLFWKGRVQPGEPLVVSDVNGYFLRITNASLGVDAKKNTRTSLKVTQASDQPTESPGIICTLKNDYENHQLNILVTDDIQLSVSGDNPSTIYLVGYFSPAEQYISENPFDVGDDLEEMDDIDEMEDVEEPNQLGISKKQVKGARKRTLAEMNMGGEGETDMTASPLKKQKTKGGEGKPNKNDQQNKPKTQNPNQNKNQKGNKKDKQNNQETSEKPNEVEATKTVEEATSKQALETEKESEGANEEKKNKNPKEGWKTGFGGIKYKDLHVGEGKPVKNGSKVRVYYVGQLPNKKPFDKTLSGEGFEFKVGAGEVIQGWEKGLFGMKVGGKRRLIIPPKLAYGSEGSPPDIPPNSELTFTIEVKSVN